MKQQFEPNVNGFSAIKTIGWNWGNDKNKQTLIDMFNTFLNMFGWSSCDTEHYHNRNLFRFIFVHVENASKNLIPFKFQHSLECIEVNSLKMKMTWVKPLSYSFFPFLWYGNFILAHTELNELNLNKSAHKRYVKNDNFKNMFHQQSNPIASCVINGLSLNTHFSEFFTCFSLLICFDCNLLWNWNTHTHGDDRKKTNSICNKHSPFGMNALGKGTFLQYKPHPIHILHNCIATKLISQSLGWLLHHNIKHIIKWQAEWNEHARACP